MDLNEQKGKPKCLSHSLQTKVLLQIYDLETLEIGTNIKGTSCLSRDDLTKAHGNNVQLLYGEILPSGIRKLFDKEHLDASKYKVFYDMGCGVGKLTIQVPFFFLFFPFFCYRQFFFFFLSHSFYTHIYFLLSVFFRI